MNLRFPGYKHEGEPTPYEKLWVCSDCGHVEWGDGREKVCYHSCNGTNRRMREGMKEEYEQAKAALKPYFPPTHNDVVKTTLIRAPRHPGRVHKISVIGHRDPRGPDNEIEIWVDANDKLHIRVQKADRCYRFEQMIEMPGYVEVVQG